jgi:hypothetical protein
MSHNDADSVKSAIPICWVVVESEAQRVSNFKNIHKDNSLKIKDVLFPFKI